MADIQKLVEELSKLTVLEAVELSKALEETWGVSAAAAVAVAAGPAAGPAAEEKSEFDVVFTLRGLLRSHRDGRSRHIREQTVFETSFKRRNKCRIRASGLRRNDLRQKTTLSAGR